jgi:rhodanese-related sulfurtransferase
LPRPSLEAFSIRKAPQPFVALCQIGGHSAQAVRILLDAGFENVTSLVGGMAAWITLALAQSSPS